MAVLKSSSILNYVIFPAGCSTVFRAVLKKHRSANCIERGTVTEEMDAASNQSAHNRRWGAEQSRYKSALKQGRCKFLLVNDAQNGLKEKMSFFITSPSMNAGLDLKGLFRIIGAINHQTVMMLRTGWYLCSHSCTKLLPAALDSRTVLEWGDVNLV